MILRFARPTRPEGSESLSGWLPPEQLVYLDHRAAEGDAEPVPVGLDGVSYAPDPDGRGWAGEYFAGILGAQTTRTLRNVLAIVEAAGATLDDIMVLRVDLTSRDDFPIMSETYGAFVEIDAFAIVAN